MNMISKNEKGWWEENDSDVRRPKIEIGEKYGRRTLIDWGVKEALMARQDLAVREK